MKIKSLLLIAAMALMLASCGITGKEVVYVQNIDEIPSAALANAITQAGDFSINLATCFTSMCRALMRTP